MLEVNCSNGETWRVMRTFDEVVALHSDLQNARTQPLPQRGWLFNNSLDVVAFRLQQVEQFVENVQRDVQVRGGLSC